jgi:hypothetical protein
MNKGSGAGARCLARDARSCVDRAMAEALTFVPLSAGALAIGHRPRVRGMARLKAEGVTHVVTALSEPEGPGPIGRAVRNAGLTWIWIPLGSTKVLPARARPDLVAKVDEIVEALDGGARVYLHCAAGIHRTGMLSAALMFRLGHDETFVRGALATLRTVTAEGVGEPRFDWAKSFAR